MQKKEKEASAVPTTSSAPVTPDYAAGLLSSSQLSSVPASPAASYGLPATNAALPGIAAKTNPPLQGSSATQGTTKHVETLEQQPVAAPAAMSTSSQQHEAPRAAAGEQGIAATPATAEVVRRTTATIGELAALSNAGIQHIAVQNVAPTTQQTAVVVTTQPQQRVGLSLSLDQVSAAQEMFKNSNKVSRSEKALILGFMAGSRANPCPELGNLITIRLSENKEDIMQPGGTVKQAIVETHFQMNYNTGEWKRVRKIRDIED